MELKLFEDAFARFCDSHVQACEESMAANPDFEITEPQFLALFGFDGTPDVDRTALIDLNAAPGVSTAESLEEAMPLVRAYLKAMRQAPAGMLNKLFRTDDGVHPENTKVVGVFVVSEGWTLHPKTRERLEEISMVVMESTDYKMALATWRKVDGKMVPIERHVHERYTHEASGRLNNLFGLEPLEEVERAH